VVFTPTRAPLDELALRVAPLAGADASAVRRGLAADPAWFALTARQAALARPHRPPGTNGSMAERDQPSRQGRLLLVVDQFEELFTQCADEGQRRAFITALHAAATPGTARIRHRPRWWCWGYAPISRPGARTTRSWPARSRTGTWSRR
jgi:hypothetical protein